MTTDRRLPAVVWDMGGIMYRYFTELLLERADQEGWPPIALGPTGTVPDPDYEAQSRGEIDETDYLEVIRERLDAAGIDLEPTTAFDFSEHLRPATWQLIEDIHEADHPQALVTNDATKWLGERWWDTWEPVRWFDTILDVQEIGVRKPAAEPYLIAASRLGLDPSDCLFIDDMQVNCDGAEAVGMRSHRFMIDDPQRSIMTLRRRLGLPVPSSDRTEEAC